MRKTFRFALLLIILLGLSLPGYAQSGPDYDIKIWPSKLERDATPGTTQEFGINVQNLGVEAQTLKIYLNDYFISPDNTFVYEEPGHYSYSCAKWVKAREKQIEVVPGETKVAVFSLTVPPDAEPGGHYAVVFFEQVPKETEGETVASTVPRIGVVLLVTVPGEIIRELEIKDVSVTSTWFWPSRKLPVLPRKRTTARVVIYNPGNVHVTAKGSLTYAPTFGWGADTIDLGELTILPETERYLEAEIPNPPLLGSYEVNAIVAYGPDMFTFDTELTGKATFHSYPISLFLALLFLTALVVTAYEFFAWRRKRKTRSGEISGTEEKAEKKEGQKGAEHGEETEGRKKKAARLGDSLREGKKRLEGLFAGRDLWTGRLRDKWRGLVAVMKSGGTAVKESLLLKLRREEKPQAEQPGEKSKKGKIWKNLAAGVRERSAALKEAVLLKLRDYRRQEKEKPGEPLEPAAVEEPEEMPGETHFKEPEEKPAGVPVEEPEVIEVEPTEEPEEIPGEIPEEVPAEEPEVAEAEPEEEPVEELVVAGAAEPEEEPVEEAAEEPAVVEFEEPEEEPVEVPPVAPTLAAEVPAEMAGEIVEGALYDYGVIKVAGDSTGEAEEPVIETETIEEPEGEPEEIPVEEPAVIEEEHEEEPVEEAAEEPEEIEAEEEPVAEEPVEETPEQREQRREELAEWLRKRNQRTEGAALETVLGADEDTPPEKPSGEVETEDKREELAAWLREKKANRGK